MAGGCFGERAIMRGNVRGIAASTRAAPLHMASLSALPAHRPERDIAKGAARCLEDADAGSATQSAEARFILPSENESLSGIRSR